VRQPGEGVSNIGIFNKQRCFPATERNYIISSRANEADSKTVDFVEVPTSDAVAVRIEGQALFRLTTDAAVLREFYRRFGVRTFDGQHPYDGDSGWVSFLAIQFRPVLDNALRETIGRFRCEQLVSSCALLSNRGGQLDERSGDKTNANLVAVQKAIADALNQDLAGNLGGQYFKNVQVVVSAVKLPDRVQTAVNEAQAQFAEVNKANADLQKARIRKKVNDTLGRSYENCPACAEIDALKSIPSNVTAISLGGGGSIALNASKK
jgi:regulator of protease activity HflC (stomatin/prohibitin superfamily)